MMFEQKSVLARLLSNENITVKQGNLDTASFDVKSRELYLPMWKDMGSDIYDLLVGHEVSHAIYTPQNFDTDYNTRGLSFGWINIAEDIRIEKLILRKYPGLVSNFKRGYYQIIMDMDLFGIKDVDLNTLGFWDRLNIHAKARDLLDVPFAADEKRWVERAKYLETFEDVVQFCHDVRRWLKEKSVDNQQSDEFGVDGEAPDVGESPEGARIHQLSEAAEAGDDESESDDEAGEAGEAGDDESESDDEAGEAGDDESESDDESAKGTNDPVSGDSEQHPVTEERYRKNQHHLIDENAALYVFGVDRNVVEKTIISYQEIAKSRRESSRRLTFPQDQYVKFLKETKQIVNLMVREFEMRKAAYQHQRARTSTKGSLDVNKVHKYRYDDQLFKQVTQLADAKNHGMIMLIDYSGSMVASMPSVIRQLLALVMFCKRVSIPFEVYGFATNPRSDGASRAQITGLRNQDHINVEELNLLELFNVSMNKKQYDEAFRMMFWQTINGQTKSHYEQMASTPLNQALLCAHILIDDFREKYRVQKMNLVTLTDGHSNPISVTRGLKRPETYGKALTTNAGKRMIHLPSRYQSGTAALVQSIRDKDVKTIDYHIKPDVYGEIRSALGVRGNKDERYKQKVTEIRSLGAATLENSAGYDLRFFILSKDSSFAGKTDELDVNQQMSTKKIASQFAGMNRSKKKSRILTQKFAEIVS